MNWFERYGIPGIYFVGLMAGWVYALCPETMRGITQSNNLNALVVALAGC